jgi:hypothetical protein
MRRLLAFILIFALFLAFIVFNLENKSDISFGFISLEGIPVFLTVFSSFVLGMLFAVPFILGSKRKKLPHAGPPAAVPPAKQLWGSKKQKNHPETDEIKKENSPYGID